MADFMVAPDMNFDQWQRRAQPNFTRTINASGMYKFERDQKSAPKMPAQSWYDQ
jgi:hypothetical protein